MHRADSICFKLLAWRIFFNQVTFSISVILYIWMFYLLIYLYCVNAVLEVRRGHQISWNWSYRWLGAIMWATGIKLGSSGRTASAAIHWALSQATSPLTQEREISNFVCSCTLSLPCVLTDSSLSTREMVWELCYEDIDSPTRKLHSVFVAVCT